jgi:hypothetical protein
LQYAELAQRRGTTGKTDVDAFVSQNMARLREQFIDGTNLERQVFFSESRQSANGRTKFDGCAKCHEVKPNSFGAPTITAPSPPDRWMVRAHFDHAKHASVDCSKCHAARASASTTDVIMPSKVTCAECHSVKGKVSSDCASCHTYHTLLHPAGFTTQ